MVTEILTDKDVTCLYCFGNCKIKYKNLCHKDWKYMKNIDIYECGICRSLITYPMPSKEKLSECYSEYVKGFPDYKSKAKEKSNQDLWYKKVLKILNIKKLKNMKIADIGAGEGFFVLELLKNCENCELDCFDYHEIPNRLKINHGGNKVNWRQGDVMDDTWRNKEKYDIVICNAVIEHVREPRKLVDSLYDITKEGGIFYVLAPCVNSLLYKMMRKNWIYIIPGEHLTIPSFFGLREFMKKYDVEYELKKINVSYSLNYILGSLFRIKVPMYFDVLISLPTGSFSLGVRKNYKLLNQKRFNIK